MNHINQYYNKEKIEEFDFKENLEIVMCTKDTRPSKVDAYKIIERADLLQYHYFSQEYDVLKTASYTFLVYLKQNKIKHLIGFISINTPTLTKKIRNVMYGTNFLSNLYSIKNDKLKPQYKDVKIFNLSRMVILPSFRGLGISKYIQEQVILQLQETPGFACLEFSSNMFHNIDFASDVFNKTALYIDKEKYTVYNGMNVDPEKKSGIKGYKGETKHIAVILNYWKEDDYTVDLMREFYKKFYNLNLDKEETRKALNNTLDTRVYTSDSDVEKLKTIFDERIPLFLLNFMNLDELVKLEYNKRSPKLEREQIIKEREVEEW